MRLIDADGMRENLQLMENTYGEMQYSTRGVMEMLMSQPTIDTGMKESRWISHMGRTAIEEWCERCNGISHGGRTRYCERCGARMVNSREE